jgi:acyl-CoA synthetase (AMP-forming)/AMP-acid ligase II
MTEPTTSNCVERLAPHVRERPGSLAIWTTRDGAVSMGDFGQLVASAQALLRRAGVKPGDHVLLVALPSPRMYATLIGLFGMGAVAVLIEPWMPVARIEHVVQQVQPKAFVASLLGKLWGLRVPAVRAIPSWISASNVGRSSGEGGMAVEPIGPEARAMVTFTSGTTGAPKGIVRTHRYMEDARQILGRAIGWPEHAAPDLTVFPGFAMLNLASGRGSVLVPSKWRTRDLETLGALDGALAPDSLVSGPAFLAALLQARGFTKLRAFFVGGALTDCSLVEALVARWPDARVDHIYGGTEAEPVALTDARGALAKSRARGLHQLLYLGGPVPEIRSRPSPEGLWVAGPHVSPEYVGATDENRKTKHRDAEGTLWHNMGDRIDVDGEGWWYAGRASQRDGDFPLEQRVYSRLGSSASFIHRNANGEAILVGEGVRDRESEIRAAFPEIARVREGRIHRDRRHRARIDRAETARRAKA